MPETLSALFQLAPEKAVEYLDAKGYRPTWNWWEMRGEAHAKAFTVAKVARLDILEDIRSAVQTAHDEGRTERWFIKDLQEVLQRKGWWGKKVDVNPNTGEVQRYQAGSVRRLQTIYRTNLQTAYMAGRQRQFDEEIDRAPYVQYLAVLDSHTRPGHAALDGKVFRLDDPAWEVIAPPNGFNCRCRARNLSQRELEARGLTVETDTRLQIRNPSGKRPADTGTGDTPSRWTQQGISLPDTGRSGKRLSFYPDPGWDYNPGRSAPWADIDLWQRVRATLSPATAAEALHEHTLHPTRLTAFEAWVDEVLSQDGSRGREWVIGYLQEADIQALIERGGNVANGSVVLSDRLLSGPKARRHGQSGNALSADEWKQIPRLLAEPQAVLYDTVNHTLLYVLPSADGRKTKIVVEGGRVERKRPAYESVRSAFKVDVNNLHQEQFVIVRGSLN